MNSGGSGLNGAVSSIAAFAASSFEIEPEDLLTLIESNLPSLPILKSTTTRFEASPFGGFQFLLILRSSSRIYGPQSGDLIASIPGGPDGLPGPGFPIEPVPYPVPLVPGLPVPEVVPEPDEPLPLDGDNCGDGIPVPVPLEEPPPCARVPVDVPLPAEGLGPTGASVFGTATLNGLFGAVASFGIEGLGGSAVGL